MRLSIKACSTMDIFFCSGQSLLFLILCLLLLRCLFFFFFSSRRRHTRCSRDWSSDVCSSDLSTEQARREDDRRIVLITTELVKELERRSMYRVLDRAPAAQLIERLKASHELRACNGCEIDIGKALGAERIALCWVQKVSNLILNINVEVHSVATGETLYVNSVDIRGNTDETWLRGVRRLAENIQERNHHLR